MRISFSFCNHITSYVCYLRGGKLGMAAAAAPMLGGMMSGKPNHGQGHGQGYGGYGQGHAAPSHGHRYLDKLLLNSIFASNHVKF